jgi:hypothetical protein
MQIALNEHKRPTATTIQYGKYLEMSLRKAQKRVGTTSDPLGDRRAVRDAQIALDTFNETMSRLLLDCEAP